MAYNLVYIRSAMTRKLEDLEKHGVIAGLEIGDGTTVDQAGKLILKGKWLIRNQNPEQRKKFQELLTKEMPDSLKPLLAAGIGTEGMLFNDAYFQTEIPKRFRQVGTNPRLAGVIVDGASFDSDDKLSLKGRWLGHLQAPQLADETRSLLSRDLAPLLANGLSSSWNGMQFNYRFVEEHSWFAAIRKAWTSESNGLRGSLVLVQRDGEVDDQGRLPLQILADSEAQAETLIKEISRVLKAEPGLGQVIKDVVVSVKEIVPIRSNLRRVQEEFARPRAGGDTAVLRQTRLDEVYFGEELSRDGTPRLVIVGVSMADSQSGKDFRKLLDSRLTEIIREKFRFGTFDRIGFAVDTQKITHVAQPGTSLQRIVAQNRSLDGVRLDEGAVFNGNGVLLLNGLWLGRQQESSLQSFVLAELAPEQIGLATKGLAWNSMRECRTDAILKDLRSWTAANLDEVWLDRLHFDAEGILEIRGQCTDSIAAGAVRSQLDRILQEHPMRSNILGEISHARVNVACLGTTGLTAVLDAMQQEKTPRINLGIRRPLAPHLRNVSFQDPALEGVLIDRCFIDEAGVHQVEAILDSNNQESSLRLLLRRITTESDWKERLTKGLEISSFATIPLSSLLDRLRRVMPAYPLFDGMKIERLNHNESGALVLGITRVVDKAISLAEMGDDERKRAAVRLLATRSEWKPRIRRGIALNNLALVARNEYLAERSFWQALSDFKRCDGRSNILPIGNLLDVALLHSPGDRTAWKLRAMYYLVQGDLELSERDIRRMLQASRPKGQYGLQYMGLRFDHEKLEDIQGWVRIATDRMASRVTADPMSGFPPLEISEIPEVMGLKDIGGR